MTETTTETTGAAGSTVLVLKVIAIASLAGGVYLLDLGGQTGISGGILSLTVSLAAGAVLLGSGSWGPATEGNLDLSARLGVGFLGGLLGAAVSALVAWLFERLGVPQLFGVSLLTPLAGPADHLIDGAVWGTVLGILLPAVPGSSLVARGAAFSIVPSLYLMLKVLPFDMDLGVFGVGLGPLAFLFIFFYNIVWGATAGRVLGWAAATELAPVSRPVGR